MMEGILIGNKGRIDFSTPVSMSEEQKNKFFKLLNKLYFPVEIDYVTDFRKDRLGQKEITARWTAKEYRVLLGIDDYHSVAKKLGRTEMSVIMRSGSIIPRLVLWCEERNVAMKDIKLEHIEAFLKEKEDKKIEKKKKRRIKTDTIRKIEKITESKIEPCMVRDHTFYGGECEKGFHEGCLTCPRSKGFITNKEDIKRFNEVYLEEFLD